MIPEHIQRFVLTSIPSVPYLEAALLFQNGAQADRNPVELARALYLPEAKAAELLDALCRAGILEACPGSEGRYRYAPRDAALASTLQELAQVYSSDMIGVTHLIHDSTQKTARRFADAFKLRRDP